MWVLALAAALVALAVLVALIVLTALTALTVSVALTALDVPVALVALAAVAVVAAVTEAVVAVEVAKALNSYEKSPCNYARALLCKIRNKGQIAVLTIIVTVKCIFDEFELFKEVTGVTELEQSNKVFLLDVDTMEGNWHHFCLNHC